MNKNLNKTIVRSVQFLFSLLFLMMKLGTLPPCLTRTCSTNLSYWYFLIGRHGQTNKWLGSIIGTFVGKLKLNPGPDLETAGFRLNIIWELPFGIFPVWT